MKNRKILIIISIVVMIFFLMLLLFRGCNKTPNKSENTSTDMVVHTDISIDIITSETDLEGTEIVENEVTTEEASTEKATTEEITTEDVKPSSPVSPSYPADNNTPSTEDVKPSVNPPTTEAPSNNGSSTTPTTETPAVPSVPSTPSTTETPSVLTTEEVKECQHNWVEVMTTKEEYSHTDHICLYCGFVTTDLNVICDHTSNCGGVWTHEELTSAGVTPEDAIYQVRIGRAKGTTYTSKERYNTIEVGTGKYYCDKCYHTKQN